MMANRFSGPLELTKIFRAEAGKRVEQLRSYQLSRRLLFGQIAQAAIRGRASMIPGGSHLVQVPEAA